MTDKPKRTLRRSSAQVRADRGGPDRAGLTPGRPAGAGTHSLGPENPTFSPQALQMPETLTDGQDNAQ